MQSESSFSLTTAQEMKVPTFHVEEVITLASSCEMTVLPIHECSYQAVAEEGETWTRRYKIDGLGRYIYLTEPRNWKPLA